MEAALTRHPRRQLARLLLLAMAVELAVALTFLALLLPVDVASGSWVYWRAVAIVAGVWIGGACVFGGWRVALIACGSRRWRGDAGWLWLFGLLVVGYPALEAVVGALRLLVSG